MISEEKMLHILHLMLDGIYHADMVDYPDEDLAMREAKKIGYEFVKQMESVGDLARKRISSQKSPPLENSPQWEVLYQKYYEEEMKKKGG